MDTIGTIRYIRNIPTKPAGNLKVSGGFSAVRLVDSFTKGAVMQLISTDPDYSGYVDEVRRYRTDAAGVLYAAVVLVANGRWYSGMAAVDVRADLLHTVRAA